MTAIAPHIEAFLREHLGQHRGASQHTCDSYAYSFQLLFEFAARRFGVGPSQLKLEQLDAELIGSFLKDLESGRGNSPDTRNTRLAAIRSFFRFLEYREPAALEQIRRVLAIPFKRTNTCLVPYLAQDQVQALLDAPDPATRDGIRDRAMLHLAVCNGLRVSELTGLCTTDITLPSMTIRGPGKRPERTRAAPLESDGDGTPSMVGGAWNSRGTGVVCQRARPTPEPMGSRLCAATPCTKRRPKLPVAIEEAGLTACFEAHLRDDRAPIHPRYS